MPDLVLSEAMDAFLAEEDPANVFLPLAGGTMDDNATILWDNGSAIREAGDQGLEIECSVGYRWQWVAGRMILREVNSGQIKRIIAIDAINPSATDDEAHGFVVGTRWETVDGSIYVCTDATTDNAVWSAVYQHYDQTGVSSIDWVNRRLNDTSGNPILEWSNPYQVDIALGVNLGVDYISGAGASINGISLVDGQLFTYGGSFAPSVNWASRQLIGPDGMTIVADWSCYNYTGLQATNIDSGTYNVGGYTSGGGYSAFFPQGIDHVGTGYIRSDHGFVGSGGISAASFPFGVTSGNISNLYGGSAYIDMATASLNDSGTRCIDWLYKQLNTGNGTSSDKSIDWGTRQLFANDGYTVMMDWSNPNSLAVGMDMFISAPYSVIVGDSTYVYLSPNGIGNNTGIAIDVTNYQLKANDGTVALDWATPYQITLSSGTSISEPTMGTGFAFLSGEVALYNAGSGLNLGSYPLKADQITNGGFNGPPSLTYGATYTPNTVAALTGGEGTIAYVNDADNPTLGSAVVGGGSAKCLVCENGAMNWIVIALL